MKKPNYIFVIGFMASGKSTFGKRIAKELGYNFIDTDKEIERLEGKTISQTFEENGEQYFRKLEMIFLKSINNSENTLFSTGGKMTCNQYRLNRMKKLGKLIHLEIDAKSVINRLKSAKQKRPILANLTEEELSKKIISLLDKRTRYYDQSDITISSLSSKKVKAGEIIF